MTFIEIIFQVVILVVLMGISLTGLFHNPIGKNYHLNRIEKLLSIGLLLPLKLAFVLIFLISTYEIFIIFS